MQIRFWAGGVTAPNHKRTLIWGPQWSFPKKYPDLGFFQQLNFIAALQQLNFKAALQQLNFKAALQELNFIAALTDTPDCFHTPDLVKH